MSIPTKRLKNGFEMPIYGLGTSRMGGTPRERVANHDDSVDLRAIESAVEHGVSHIDTAEMYAAGHAEELVGTAIKRFERDSLFLATKVSPEHFRAPDLVRACENSLRRLKTDYVDLYLLHNFHADVSLTETFGAMDSLVERELVGAIGVCNFGPTNLDHAMSAAQNPVVVNQVHYNLSVREAEASNLVEFCQERDVLLMAWRPLRDQGLEAASVVQKLVHKYDRSPRQIAINWLISQNNVITISRTRSDPHLEENLGALDFLMEPEDIELLRREYPDQTFVSEAVPLDS